MRARLVAKGYTQVPGIDYKDNFSPVCNDATLRVMLIIWLVLNLDQGQMDVETAFLEGHLPDDYKIYMKAPEGMEMEVGPDECLEIKKGYPFRNIFLPGELRTGPNWGQNGYMM